MPARTMSDGSTRRAGVRPPTRPRPPVFGTADSARSTTVAMTPLLDSIRGPADLRRLDRTELPHLAHELRGFILRSVSETGGHLSSNLGTVELAIALHYVFNT